MKLGGIVMEGGKARISEWEARQCFLSHIPLTMFRVQILLILVVLIFKNISTYFVCVNVVYFYLA